MNGIEPCAPSFGFRELKEGTSEPSPAMTRINCDVVDEKAFVFNGEDEYSHDRSVALCDRYSMVAYDICVIVGHRPRHYPDALDVVSVGGVNKGSHFRNVGLVGRPK
jgi:hypothetical protein